MSDGQDIRGRGEGASSIALNARQLRGLVSLLDAFETGDADNPAYLDIWVQGPNDGDGGVGVRVEVHAAVTHDAPEGEIACLIDEHGHFYDYDSAADVIRWFVPVSLPGDPTTTYPYKGGLLCYRSEGEDARTWQP